MSLEVLPLCKNQAEPIMNEGKAEHYDRAARWVERARNAYRAAGQEKQWQEYKSDLLGKHQRKRKLVPILQSL